ncbi:hypothetical protein PsYK624_155540 [Phanerochaete sordida]|uniref:Hydroxyneurosporene synthase n=1 Tax=Phanerochaete sordida TaxID=48140 RepID=A0A9P3GR33_9APHY|nr:hypothetical protein PsYK624_155540 [Phanerochaete sordida]
MYSLLQVLAFVASLTVCSLAAAVRPLKRDATFVIPGQTSSSASTVQFAAGGAFDGPKVANLNSTTFDLWYFHAFSPDLAFSVTIVFYTALPGALFPGSIDFGTADYVEIFVTQPTDVDVLAFPADTLTVTTSGDGSSGAFDTGEAGWIGSSDMSEYTITFNAQDGSLSGTVSLSSVAPAHFPCGPLSSSSSFELSPGLGWANAIPDADATVNLLVLGNPVVFTGIGYHDKNWGNAPWDTLLNSWYWGHARLGAYSVVWFDFVETTGAEGVSAFVSQNGQVVAAACSGLQVRPVGGDATYPPTTQTGTPDGFTLSFDVPGQGTLEMEVPSGEIILQTVGESTRWIGEFTGTLAGQSLSGVGLYEQFTFAS